MQVQLFRFFILSFRFIMPEPKTQHVFSRVAGLISNNPPLKSDHYFFIIFFLFNRLNSLSIQNFTFSKPHFLRVGHLRSVFIYYK